MKIIIDVDCTVADFIGAVHKISNEKDRLVANKWGWFTHIYPKEVTEEIYKTLTDANWWRKIPIIKDSNKGIAWLRGQGHTLIWATVPYKNCFGWTDARREWLEKNFRIDKHKETLIFMDTNKYLINADMIIDDNEETIDAYASYHPKAICLTFKSEINRNLDRELVTWEDIMQMEQLFYGKNFL